jgi:hypothetical protein
MHLPKPRGAFSEQLLAALATADPSAAERLPDPDAAEDAALALWCLYELSYRGFEEVDDRLEWAPGLIAVRRGLEEELEERLRARWSGVPAYEGDFSTAFFAEVEAHEGPSLARFVQRRATADQVMELLQARSIYHLKESDPVAFSVPRLPVAPRAALMELQYDEYGGGRPERLHAHLFAEGLAALGLDPAEGAYLDQAPLAVLEENNAMSLFGLNRRLRGASVGHLAAFEATSSGPCRRMSRGLERLGLAPEMRAYYDEHVEADAVHEQLAVRLICQTLIEAEPETEADVWFGAFSCLDLEDRVAHHYLDRWGVTA